MKRLDVPALWSKAMGAAIAKQDQIAAGLYAPGQTLAQMREGYLTERRFWNEGGPAMASTEDAGIPTSHGEVGVRIYRPTDGTLPIIFYIHGGGFALGNLDTHDRICRNIADEAGAAVVAIDYTLSPEAKFPQAIEECAQVVQYVRSHAKTWDLDSGDISFAGDSGGANMSIATYLYLRDVMNDAGGVRCFLLYYGWFGLKDSVSIRLYGGVWDGLTPEDFSMYKQLYITREADLDSPYLNIFNADLEGLPPAYICAAELDPLLDDSRLLAKIYETQGVSHELEVVPGVIHAFLHHGRMLDAARQVMAHGGTFFTSIPSPTHPTGK
ncbi:acetylesterase [Trueperella sp. HMSC08B05]|uniref:Acetyl esterase n=2 Tax=Trueperella bernardiae TaxID=59561 RepID=A0AAW6ZJ12_9ACTO|nr:MULTISPECIES: acetyl esterase [Trueperella]MDK8601605.1 acetyl esterase [Trueperella bernardiae]MDV6238685.1 acetyl esterase [Trueperella bernardiae]OFS68786.1 acetylesterase [Trueperella sp. HMSC08H06]OFS76429.1 acetylesterase [Trueperella sp. HMSC08B05]PKZ89637.1 acetyl esterase [Trueperella bernardiae]